jgi:hypothetical protein
MRGTLPRVLFSFALAGVGMALAACPDDPTDSDKLDWLRDGGDHGNASELVVDATAKDAWTYVSFETGVIAAPADPKASLDWDVAFQRYNVKTNGGTSGPGQGAAAELGALDLKDTTTAAVGSWTADAEIADARTNSKQSMNSILSGWYDYHFLKHVLVSKYRLYAIRAADGRVALFKIYDYYDDVGAAGKLTILFRFPVQSGDAPDAGPTGTPDAGTPELLDDVITETDGIVRGETNFDARTRWSYFSFASRGAVTVEGEARESAAWDLAFDQWLVASNSGTSGSAGAGVKLAETEFDAAVTAPTEGYEVDSVQAIGAEQRLESVNPVTAGWFEYDPTTQKIRSVGHVYWVRTAAGRYAKLQVLGYYHPDGSGGFYRLKWAYRPDGGTGF